MKKTILILTILLILNTLNAVTTRIDPDEYIIKAGDVFFIHSSILDSLMVRTPVLPAGSISLFPFSDSVNVAGLTLSTAYKNIHEKVGNNIQSNRFLIQLGLISPMRFNVMGAVNRPGEYISDNIITLQQALVMANGLSSTASRHIRILRNNEIREYDLNKFFAYGDTSVNPMIMQDDVIMVNLATDYVTVYTNTEGNSTIETIEIEMIDSIADVLEKVVVRHQASNLNVFTIERDGVYFEADRYFAVMPNDNIYIAMHELFVYVTGFVARPGRLSFNGSVDAFFYIAQSGGVIPAGSNKKIYLVQNQGEHVLYTDQIIKPGDVLYVPESTRSKLVSWLIPASTVISLVYTMILIGYTW